MRDFVEALQKPERPFPLQQGDAASNAVNEKMSFVEKPASSTFDTEERA